MARKGLKDAESRVEALGDKAEADGYPVFLRVDETKDGWKVAANARLEETSPETMARTVAHGHSLLEGVESERGEPAHVGITGTVNGVYVSTTSAIMGTYDAETVKAPECFQVSFDQCVMDSVEAGNFVVAHLPEEFLYKAEALALFMVGVSGPPPP